MSVLPLIVALDPYGERYQAVVRVGPVDPSPNPSPNGRYNRGDLLSAVVRDAPHDAVVLALEHAAHEVADELARQLVNDTVTATEAREPA